MLEKNKYLKKIKCWRNRNIQKNGNVGERNIFKKWKWRNRNIKKMNNYKCRRGINI